jgi:hypothetical protein
MFEEDGVLVVEVALAGVRFEDVSVRVHGTHLVVSALRPHPSGARRYHLRGRRAPQQLVQEVMLPPHACPDQATATYAHGLLRVCIPLGAEEPIFATPIAVEHRVRAQGMGKGSPAGAGTDKGGVRPVPGSGFPLQSTPVATVRRCALCNAWMDGPAGDEPPADWVATRIRYGLCEACQPVGRERDA